MKENVSGCFFSEHSVEHINENRLNKISLTTPCDTCGSIMRII